MVSADSGSDSYIRLILETSLPGIRMALLSGSFRRGDDSCSEFQSSGQSQSSSVVLAETLLPKGRGEQLDGLLQDVLNQAKATLPQIKQVLVTLGPGSFTGLRTGIAFAEGLCFAGNRELYSISTLKALRCLRRLAAGSAHSQCAVVLKARPGWFYVGQDLGLDSTSDLASDSSRDSVDISGLGWHEAMIDTEALHQRSFKNQVCIFDSTQGLSENDFPGNSGCVDLAEGFSLQHFDLLWDQAERGQVRPNYIQKSYAEQ